MCFASVEMMVRASAVLAWSSCNAVLTLMLPAETRTHVYLLANSGRQLACMCTFLAQQVSM